MGTVNTRLTLLSVIVGCVLAVSSSGCDSTRPSMFAAPTAPSAPTAPTVPTVTLSGTVVERFSGQPIQGVEVGLFPLTRPMRPHSWPPGGGYRRTPSDAAGRYTVTNIPADFGSFSVLATYPEWGKYAQQCLTTVTLYSDADRDVTLTSLQNRAAGNSLRPPPVPGTRTVSGIVFEITKTGRQPIEGAWVGFTVDPSGDVTAAEAFSDASGRYLLCGLPEGRLSLLAAKNGYSRDDMWKSVDAGSDTTLDIELRR
jgi:hypothetical protein